MLAEWQRLTNRRTENDVGIESEWNRERREREGKDVEERIRNIEGIGGEEGRNRWVYVVD